MRQQSRAIPGNHAIVILDYHVEIFQGKMKNLNDTPLARHGRHEVYHGEHRLYKTPAVDERQCTVVHYSAQMYASARKSRPGPA